ncbi:MAG TPA: type II toxin-antitoxin system RelE/ParE family toxin [Dongiaceae bacterium]|nr:type II toxin-antitoxin system RelE/ParE family toxin [Dongiaceae bacterium]
MIQSVECSDTKRLWLSGKSKPFAQFPRVALRKLDMLNAVIVLGDLRPPPGNRLEALKGDRKGEYCIRVNEQFRICFVWTETGPANIEIVA